VVFVLIAIITVALDFVCVVPMQEARRTLHAVTPIRKRTTDEPIVRRTFGFWAEQVVVIDLRCHTLRAVVIGVVAITLRLATIISISIRAICLKARTISISVHKAVGTFVRDAVGFAFTTYCILSFIAKLVGA
jgi:hypothetical protein